MDFINHSETIKWTQRHSALGDLLPPEREELQPALCNWLCSSLDLGKAMPQIPRELTDTQISNSAAIETTRSENTALGETLSWLGSSSVAHL